MELSGFIFVALLNFIPFGCSKLVDFCQLPYCGTNNLACNNPSVSGVQSEETTSVKLCICSEIQRHVSTECQNSFHVDLQEFITNCLQWVSQLYGEREAKVSQGSGGTNVPIELLNGTGGLSPTGGHHVLHAQVLPELTGVLLRGYQYRFHPLFG